MELQLYKGVRGRFKATKKKFEVMGSGGSYTTLIRFKYESRVHECFDKDLREFAEGLNEEEWRDG